MIKIIKEGGLTIIGKKIKGESVSISVMVNVGSNLEKGNFGISHFLEHMMFDTKNRSAIEIASEIEKVGGRINAYTGKDRTAYFGKVPKKYFRVLVDVLADLISNPKFDVNEIKKEKNIVYAETKMVFDNPRMFQQLLMEKTLFRKHPAGNPTLGHLNYIRKITRNDLVNYYNKYYKRGNMVVCVVGDFNNLNIIKGCFRGVKGGKVNIRLYEEPLLNEDRKVKNRKETLHSYIGCGYHAAARTSKDSYVFDIIETALGYGMSSILGREIREKRGLAYYVNAEYDGGKDFGYLSIQLSTDKKNTNLVKDIILSEVKKLKNISVKDLNDIKKSIEGQFLLDNEDSFKLADRLARFYLLKDVKFVRDYLRNIRKVKVNDVKRIINRYMKHYSFVVVEK